MNSSFSVDDDASSIYDDEIGEDGRVENMPDPVSSSSSVVLVLPGEGLGLGRNSARKVPDQNLSPFVVEGVPFYVGKGEEEKYYRNYLQSGYEVRGSPIYLSDDSSFGGFSDNGSENSDSTFEGFGPEMFEGFIENDTCGSDFGGFSEDSVEVLEGKHKIEYIKQWQKEIKCYDDLDLEVGSDDSDDSFLDEEPGTFKGKVAKIPGETHNKWKSKGMPQSELFRETKKSTKLPPKSPLSKMQPGPSSLSKMQPKPSPLSKKPQPNKRKGVMPSPVLDEYQHKRAKIDSHKPEKAGAVSGRRTHTPDSKSDVERFKSRPSYKETSLEKNAKTELVYVIPSENEVEIKQEEEDHDEEFIGTYCSQIGCTISWLESMSTKDVRVNNGIVFELNEFAKKINWEKVHVAKWLLRLRGFLDVEPSEEDLTKIYIILKRRKALTVTLAGKKRGHLKLQEFDETPFVLPFENMPKQKEEIFSKPGKLIQKSQTGLECDFGQSFNLKEESLHNVNASHDVTKRKRKVLGTSRRKSTPSDSSRSVDDGKVISKRRASEGSSLKEHKSSSERDLPHQKSRYLKSTDSRVSFFTKGKHIYPNFHETSISIGKYCDEMGLTINDLNTNDRKDFYLSNGVVCELYSFYLERGCTLTSLAQRLYDFKGTQNRNIVSMFNRLKKALQMKKKPNSKALMEEEFIFPVSRDSIENQENRGDSEPKSRAEKPKDSRVEKPKDSRLGKPKDSRVTYCHEGNKTYLHFNETNVSIGEYCDAAGITVNDLNERGKRDFFISNGAVRELYSFYRKRGCTATALAEKMYEFKGLESSKLFSILSKITLLMRRKPHFFTKALLDSAFAYPLSRKESKFSAPGWECKIKPNESSHLPPGDERENSDGMIDVESSGRVGSTSDVDQGKQKSSKLAKSSSVAATKESKSAGNDGPGGENAFVSGGKGNCHLDKSENDVRTSEPEIEVGSKSSQNKAKSSGTLEGGIEINDSKDVGLECLSEKGERILGNALDKGKVKSQGFSNERESVEKVKSGGESEVEPHGMLTVQLLGVSKEGKLELAGMSKEKKDDSERKVESEDKMDETESGDDRKDEAESDDDRKDETELDDDKEDEEESEKDKMKVQEEKDELQDGIGEPKGESQNVSKEEDLKLRGEETEDKVKVKLEDASKEAEKKSPSRSEEGEVKSQLASEDENVAVHKNEEHDSKRNENVGDQLKSEEGKEYPDGNDEDRESSIDSDSDGVDLMIDEGDSEDDTFLDKSKGTESQANSIKSETSQSSSSMQGEKTETALDEKTFYGTKEKKQPKTPMKVKDPRDSSLMKSPGHDGNVAGVRRSERDRIPTEKVAEYLKMNDIFEKSSSRTKQAPVSTPKKIPASSPKKIPASSPKQATGSSPKQATGSSPKQSPASAPKEAPVSMPKQTPVSLTKQTPVSVPEKSCGYSPKQENVDVKLPKEEPVSEAEFKPQPQPKKKKKYPNSSKMGLALRYLKRNDPRVSFSVIDGRITPYFKDASYYLGDYCNAAGITIKDLNGDHEKDVFLTRGAVVELIQFYQALGCTMTSLADRLLRMKKICLPSILNLVAKFTKLPQNQKRLDEEFQFPPGEHNTDKRTPDRRYPRIDPRLKQSIIPQYSCEVIINDNPKKKKKKRKKEREGDEREGDGANSMEAGDGNPLKKKKLKKKKTPLPAPPGLAMKTTGNQCTVDPEVEKAKGKVGSVTRADIVFLYAKWLNNKNKTGSTVFVTDLLREVMDLMEERQVPRIRIPAGTLMSSSVKLYEEYKRMWNTSKIDAMMFLEEDWLEDIQYLVSITLAAKRIPAESSEGSSSPYCGPETKLISAPSPVDDVRDFSNSSSESDHEDYDKSMDSSRIPPNNVHSPKKKTSPSTKNDFPKTYQNLDSPVNVVPPRNQLSSQTIRSAINNMASGNSRPRPKKFYEVDKIVDYKCKISKRKKKYVSYLIRWKDLGPEHDTWIEESILRCPENLQDLWKGKTPKPENLDPCLVLQKSEDGGTAYDKENAPHNLSYLKGKPGKKYMSNGELLELYDRWREENHAKQSSKHPSSISPKNLIEETKKALMKYGIKTCYSSYVLQACFVLTLTRKMMNSEEALQEFLRRDCLPALESSMKSQQHNQKISGSAKIGGLSANYVKLKTRFLEAKAKRIDHHLRIAAIGDEMEVLERSCDLSKGKSEVLGKVLDKEVARLNSKLARLSEEGSSQLTKKFQVENPKDYAQTYEDIRDSGVSDGNVESVMDSVLQVVGKFSTDLSSKGKK